MLQNTGEVPINKCAILAYINILIKAHLSWAIPRLYHLYFASGDSTKLTVMYPLKVWTELLSFISSFCPDHGDVLIQSYCNDIHNTQINIAFVYLRFYSENQAQCLVQRSNSTNSCWLSSWNIGILGYGCRVWRECLRCQIYH